ncbi:MAG TPA: IS3 family transposase [Candidatus Tyrphobacter sp.]
MSLRTSAGIAQVQHLSRAFDLSRAALYKAASAEKKPKPHRERRPKPTAISDERLLGEIQAITKEHPAWGHRKVWAMLRRRSILVARRRIWELMHEAQLTFAPNARRCEPRRGTVIVPMPNRRWSTDMTTVWSRKDGWVAITPVIDNGCRSVFEVGVSKEQDAPAILKPLEDSLEAEFGEPNAVPDDFELRSDHGSVYTGADCEELCDEWRVDHTFSPVGRPTGNAVAERVIQTMKLELFWLQDWEDIDEIRAAAEKWRLFYNTERPHEALNWLTPAERRAQLLGEQHVLRTAA